MKRILFSLMMLSGATTFAFAYDGPVILGPATGETGTIAPIAEDGAVIEPIPAEAIELYPCVRVKDPHHIHPCAVPKIIQIVDPCPPRNSCCDPCAKCCPPPCVNVQICVPPCGCPRVKVRRKGRYVKYDYGRYRIEVTSRRGRITVDYDD